MENLFKIAGEEFYFDLDAVSQFIKLEKEEDIDDLFKAEEELPEVSEDAEKELTDEEVMFDGGMGQMIDITKWELTKAMVETVLTEHGELDESMGVSKLETQLSIPFRFSFNTLLINKIIVKNG
jgi:hypothetical protein